MTPLCQRIIDFNYDDDERSALMRRVWLLTPWVCNVNTGSISNEGRYYDIRMWCRDNLGSSAWPFSDPPRDGGWQFGGATVNGWTYIGFKTREQMEAFQAAFPGAFDCEETP